MPNPKSAKQVIELRRHAELAPVEPGDVPVTVSVGPGGEAIALWSDPRGRDALQARTMQPGGASFPDPTTHAGVAVHVATYTPQVAAVVRVDDLRLAHCHVQPLPGGRALLVAAPCRRRRDGVDRNPPAVAPGRTLARPRTPGHALRHV